MKFTQYLIAIIIVFSVLAWTTGWFDGASTQSEIDSVMESVKNAAIGAVDTVAESAADAMDAAGGMASDATLGASEAIPDSSGVAAQVRASAADTVDAPFDPGINSSDVGEDDVGKDSVERVTEDTDQ